MAASSEFFMKKALQQAELAQKSGEVPIGAVIVCDNSIIATAHNLKESTQDPLGHAEIIAIKKACQKLGRWRLNDCDMYVTLEPCPMCAGALVQARIRKLYFASKDPKAGACGSLMNLAQDRRLNHFTEISQGLLETEAAELLKNFFKKLRSKK